MEKTKIKPITRSKEIDYGDKVVERFWLIQNKNYKFSPVDNRSLFTGILANLQDSVVCIQTEQIDDTKLINEMFNASKRRNRIYLLTNEKPNQKLEQLAGVCLMRYGIKNIGSFILVNPNANNSQGIIFTAPFLETSFASNNVALELDKQQINTLFRFFCYNFWNKATHEIISDFNDPKPIPPPPLDILPNIEDFCDSDFVIQQILEQTKNLIITLPNINPNYSVLNLEKITDSKILTSFQGNTPDLLNTVVKNQNKIFAYQELINLRLIISDHSQSWLIPKAYLSAEDNIFALLLNDSQRDRFKKMLAFLFENPRYEYHYSMKRSELVNLKVYLTSTNNEIFIKDRESKQAEDVNCTELPEKHEFESKEPQFVDDGISCKIEYTWNIHPPYLPQNAKKAKIYEDWQKIQQEFQNICGLLEKLIEENQNKNVVDKLKRFLLGKKQTFSKHLDELEQFKTITLSELEPSKRKEKVSAFNSLIKDVTSNVYEIDVEEKKSKIDTEIEELKRSKNIKQDELKEFVDTKEKEIQQKEEDKKQKLQEFCQKHNITAEELGKFKNELERTKDKKQDKIAEDQKILEELREIQGFSFKNKFEEEKRKKEKEIEDLERKIQSKLKEKEKIGKENSEQTSSSLIDITSPDKGEKHKNQKLDLVIPENLLSLPKVGELYEQGNQKFLVIEYWEEYKEAKQECQLFNAKLCVKRQNT